MDAAEHDDRAPGSGERADLVAAQRVAGVNADADDVAGLHGAEIEWLERLVGDAWCAVLGGVAPRARTASAA